MTEKLKTQGSVIPLRKGPASSGPLVRLGPEKNSVKVKFSGSLRLFGIKHDEENDLYYVLVMRRGKLERRYMVDEKEAAEHLDLEPKTLRKWRSLRKGPPIIKVGHTVRYPVDGLVTFLIERTEFHVN